MPKSRVSPETAATEATAAATTAAEALDDSSDEGLASGADCGWDPVCGVAPPACQSLATAGCLLPWLCLCSFTQGMAVNGFVNSVLTTLEIRFGLTSTESGLVAASYDIGSLVCLVPVTYVGRRYRRGRLIALGCLTMSLGSLLFALPYFTAGPYRIATAKGQTLCASGFNDTALHQQRNSSSPSSACGGAETGPQAQPLNAYKWVFWLSQFLLGMGASPFYTLAVAYLDDSLPPGSSGAYLGVYYTAGVLGPATGYLLAGSFLDLYESPSEAPPDGLTPASVRQWVGAWWPGFLLSGGLALLAAPPLYGFPTALKRQANDHRGKVEAPSVASTLVSSLGVILSSPTFIFLSLSGVADSVLITGMSTFGPKFLQTLFHMTAGAATLAVGLVTVPSAAIGLLSGGLIMRFWADTAEGLRRLLWVCVAVSAAGVCLACAFLIRCNELSFAGVNANYRRTTNSTVRGLSASCNAGCGCRPAVFDPVCGADLVTYYSPCYAGCHSNASAVAYADCTCVEANFTTAVAGACKVGSCSGAPAMLALVGLFLFAVFFLSVPTLHCTMRCLPPQLKDFGLGVQWVILRCLGSIPGPLALGRLIDSVCDLWTPGGGGGGIGCQESSLVGSCGHYNGPEFWRLVLGFAFVMKALETSFLAMAALLFKPLPQG